MTPRGPPVPTPPPRAVPGPRLVVIAGMIVMIVVVSAQVGMRYLLNDSFDWADEVSRLAFVWTVFVAIPLGIRDGAHVGITILTERLPTAARALLARLMALLAAAMMAVVLWQSVKVAAVTWPERLGAINVTSSLFFLPLVICAAHGGLHLARIAFLSTNEARP